MRYPTMPQNTMINEFFSASSFFKFIGNFGQAKAQLGVLLKFHLKKKNAKTNYIMLLLDKFSYRFDHVKFTIWQHNHMLKFPLKCQNTQPKLQQWVPYDFQTQLKPVAWKNLSNFTKPLPRSCLEKFKKFHKMKKHHFILGWYTQWGCINFSYIVHIVHQIQQQIPKLSLANYTSLIFMIFSSNILKLVAGSGEQDIENLFDSQ